MEIGSRLGPYQVTAKLGEGGMGEVWRARDTRLDRDVALKVLPEALTRSPTRLARFKREAKLLASLNHPNIGHLYGLEKQDGVEALVMELVDGYTLSTRVATARIPVAEAIRISAQIARALEAAHAQGIVHRDLKPANVMLRADGTPKLLDFGLAKALHPDPVGAPGDSPTVTTEETMAGVVMGTAAYMSPEQARGDPVDERGDVWAFGCVLYEMLAGARAFGGQTLSETLANVLKCEPDLTALPQETPGWLRRLLHFCLVKDPAGRLRHIGDARIQLESPEPEGEPFAVPAEASRGFSRGRRLAFGALLVLLGGLAALALRSAGTPVEPAFATHLELALGPGRSLRTLAQRVVAISPDGRQVAFVTGFPDARIWVRSLDEREARPVAGTERGTSPAFSPDGDWLVFWKDRQLQKVALTGSAPISLCPARTVYGASWTEDDRIIFGQAHFGIFAVPAQGGTPELLIAPDRGQGEVALEGPRLMPGGEWLLFSVLSRDQNWNGAAIVAENLETHERRHLVEGGSDPHFLRSGHLLFARGDSLHALPLDPASITVSGSPVPVVADLLRAALFETGAGQLDVSANGTLVYAIRSPPEQWTLVRVDRSGKAEELGAPPRAYIHARLSPQGDRIAVDTYDEQDVWIYEIARGTTARLTSRNTSFHPVWTADGETVIFDADLGLALERRSVAGTRGVERIASDPERHLTAVSAHPDGQTIAVERSDDFEAYDVAVLTLDSDEPLRPILANPEFREMSPVFSPDGRWLAYVSNETGRNEVYVQPYPQLDRRWLVSKGGGVEPRWSPDGTELFHRAGAWGQRMLAVRVDTRSGFSAGEPTLLFETPPGTYVAEPIGAHPTYDVWPDGRGFVMVELAPQPAVDHLQIALNWDLEVATAVSAQ